MVDIPRIRDGNDAPRRGEGMDVPRSGARPRTRRVVIVGGALVALAAVTFGVRWYANRAPAVARSELWIGTVKRGPLTLEVRGTGTLGLGADRGARR